MARGDLEHFVKTRPSAFWWILAHLLAISLAVLAWTACLFLFRYPERPQNYDWLRKLGRLEPVTSFTPLKAPEGSSADPDVLYDKFSLLEAQELKSLNLYLLRNYLTNYRSAQLNTYLVGDYRVVKTRPLRTGDFFHPGLVVTLQGYVEPDEPGEFAPYPVFIDLMLPLTEPPGDLDYPADTPFKLEKIAHRAALLHVAKSISRDEPAFHLTAVPLAYDNYQSPSRAPLTLAAPDPLNLKAPLPPTTLK